MHFVRRVTILLFVLLSFPSVHSAAAQLSVYGTISLTQFDYNRGNSQLTAEKHTAGVGGGAFYNFPIHSRLTAGIDLRASVSPGTYGGETGAAALRIGFVPHRVRLRPYFQLGAAVVSATPFLSMQTGPDSFVSQNTRITNGAVEFCGGLDIPLTPSVDLRAVELGAAAHGSPSGTHVDTAFLSAGVVYHFPGRRSSAP